MANRRVVSVVALFAASLASAGCERRASEAERSLTEEQSRELCPVESSAKVRAVFQFLHQTNGNEIRLGNLAGDRSQRPDVKLFASQMVTEHATADQSLVDLARREQVDLTPVAPADPIHAAELRLGVDEAESMETRSSDAFDVGYLASQAKQHALIVAVSDEGQKVASGDVKSLLENAREMASRHHDHALVLMQDFRFVPRAIGGGPPAIDEPRAGDRRTRDAGAWPSVTSPHERMR